MFSLNLLWQKRWAICIVHVRCSFQCDRLPVTAQMLDDEDKTAMSVAFTLMRGVKPSHEVPRKELKVLLKTQQYLGVMVAKTTDGIGKGLYATRNMAKGVLVCDYHGPSRFTEIVKGNHGSRKTGFELEYKTLGGKRVSVVPHESTLGLYANHTSKHPNMKLVIKDLPLGDNGAVIRIPLFYTLKHIKAGTELCWGYGLGYGDESWLKDGCRCNCRECVNERKAVGDKKYPGGKIPTPKVRVYGLRICTFVNRFKNAAKNTVFRES